MKPIDDTRDAQGLMFRCPKCKDTSEAHNVVLLFNLPSVPEKANPPGRWDPMEFPPHMKSISLIQEVVSNTEKCGFRGHVLGGYVNWR